ncbi:hypothetical protein F511_20762 [Dorcoceras hygrometricum]|uniref:Uncharacterized protein n=1 Tax=Dorcoceras hygrometricum TaxID=472368 RepID=A0A2Z7A7H5_9LAMI|nr:hypothetical protein F511_20762 [Dorcoceras hygrometricum]
MKYTLKSCRNYQISCQIASKIQVPIRTKNMLKKRNKSCSGAGEDSDFINVIYLFFRLRTLLFRLRFSDVKTIIFRLLIDWTEDWGPRTEDRGPRTITPSAIACQEIDVRGQRKDLGHVARSFALERDHYASDSTPRIHIE